MYCKSSIGGGGGGLIYFKNVLGGAGRGFVYRRGGYLRWGLIQLGTDDGISSPHKN